MRNHQNGFGVVAAMAVSFWIAAPAAAEWTDWIGEADASYQYDSNVNNAGFDSEELDDSIWLPTARVGRVYQFPGNTRFRAVAEVRGQIHHRWDDLNSVAGYGHLSLSHKFGLGNAPWGRVFFSGGYEGVQDDERSGYRFETGMKAGKRLTSRFDASFTYRFTARDGDDGMMAMMGVGNDVFDQQFHDFTTEGSFLVTDQLVATVGYEFRYGDLYSNARGKRMLAAGKADVKAAAWDTVFGGWSYRLEGTAHTPFVRLNYGIGDHWSVDANYRFRHADSDSLDYVNHVAGLTVLFRY
jgi:hypothetical protein